MVPASTPQVHPHPARTTIGPAGRRLFSERGTPAHVAPLHPHHQKLTADTSVSSLGTLHLLALFECRGFLIKSI